MAEAAASRLSRLLAMVPWLEQNPGVSIREAARHFGVSVPDFERDLWLTICCGLPGHGPDQLIDIQFWDEDGAIHVIDPQTLDKPLRFSAAEAMSLLVGLRLLTQIPGDHAALASVTAKLEAAAGIAQGDVVVVDETDDDVAELLQDAIAQQRAVRLVYIGASRDEITERIVEPMHLLTHGGRTYLVGWCREAGSSRTFRVDRVRAVELTAEPVTAHPSPPTMPLSHAQPVRLRVEPRSRWLLEGWDVTDASEEADGSRAGTVHVADPEWLVRIVLGQGGGVEVIEPVELRAQVRDAALRALGADEGV